MPILAWLGGWLATRVGGFVAENAIKLLMIVGAVIAVLSLLFMVRKGGADAAKLQELERALQVVKQRRQIERETKEMPDEELDDWLRPSNRRRRSR